VPSPRTLATRLKISEAIEATIHGAYPALATKYSNTTKVVFEPLADCATFSPRNATAVSRGPLKGASTAVVIIDENPNCNDDDLLTSKSDVATREEAALLGRNPRAPKIEKTKKKKKTK
jgi:hypothetical protein